MTKHISRIAKIVALFVTLFVIGWCADAVHAQGPRASGADVHDRRVNAVHRSARRDLALALAKVCVNEARFDSLADCALIWQVVSNRRAITDERRVWLERHSARVLGTRACDYRNNCAWSRNLRWDDSEPAGWPRRIRWDARAWARVRAYCWRLVNEEETLRPCEENPDTWDGRRYRRQALARGHRLVVCTGTRNDGYMYR